MGMGGATREVPNTRAEKRPVRTGRRPLVLAILAACALLLGLGAEARAAEPAKLSADSIAPGDGIYGRFDGDLSWSIGPNFAAALSSDERPDYFTLGAATSLTFYRTLGVGLGLEQTLAEDSEHTIERAMPIRVLVSPLFLLRFQRDAETGPAIFDLALDSLTVFAGGVLVEPTRSTFASEGLFEVGLGVGVPLSTTANGPWTRLSAAYRTGPSFEGFLFLLSLEWETLFESGALPAYR